MSNWQKDKTSLDILEFNYATLSKEHYKWFKQACKKAKIKNIQENNKLAGHIKEEYALDRPPDDIIRMLINMVDKRFFKYLDTIRTLTKNLPFDLADVWCNFQKKHEFNPYHDHGGVYSFVVWLRIPYEHAEQNNLPFLQGVKEQDRKAGMFEFQYYDIFGRTTHHGYRLGKDVEGVMLFFPAMFKHTVYPFYNTDETRVSVSGNLWLRPHV